MHPSSEPTAAELEIRNVLARLAQLADSGDTDEYVSLLTDDIVWAMPPNPAIGLEGSERRGHDEIAAGQRERMEAGIQGPGSNTLHTISTISVCFDDEDAATTRAIVHVLGGHRDRSRRPVDGSLRRHVSANGRRMEARSSRDHVRMMDGQRSILEGVRVVERTTGIAGAYCGKVLADAGASVMSRRCPRRRPARRPRIRAVVRVPACGEGRSDEHRGRRCRRRHRARRPRDLSGGAEARSLSASRRSASTGPGSAVPRPSSRCKQPGVRRAFAGCRIRSRWLQADESANG